MAASAGVNFRTMKLTPPIIQIALDYATIEEAISMAGIGIKAGVDWLEVGTPLFAVWRDTTQLDYQEKACLVQKSR